MFPWQPTDWLLCAVQCSGAKESKKMIIKLFFFTFVFISTACEGVLFFINGEESHPSSSETEVCRYMQVTHDCHVISCSTLSSCCHALLALLYPFEWQVSLFRYVTLYFIYSSLSLSQHTLIPVLPDELIDFCGSPLPCVFGISPSMIKKLDHLEIEMEEVN